MDTRKTSNSLLQLSEGSKCGLEFGNEELDQLSQLLQHETCFCYWWL